jgi:hypothetical protein
VVYIPKRKAQKRLRPAGAQSLGASSNISSEGNYYAAWSNMLDTVANKMLPTVASFLQEEKAEKEKIDLGQATTRMQDMFQSAGSEANPFELKDLTDQFLKDESEKDYYKGSDGKLGIQLSIKVKEELNRKSIFYLNKKLPDLIEAKKINNVKEFKSNVSDISLTDADSWSVQENRYKDDVHDRLLWEYQQKNALDPSEQLDEQGQRMLLDKLRETKYYQNEMNASQAAITSVYRAKLKEHLTTINDIHSVTPDRVQEAFTLFVKSSDGTLNEKEKERYKLLKDKSYFSFFNKLEDLDEEDVSVNARSIFLESKKEQAPIREEGRKKVVRGRQDTNWQEQQALKTAQAGLVNALSEKNENSYKANKIKLQNAGITVDPYNVAIAKNINETQEVLTKQVKIKTEEARKEVVRGRQDKNWQEQRTVKTAQAGLLSATTKEGYDKHKKTMEGLGIKVPPYAVAKILEKNELSNAISQSQQLKQKRKDFKQKETVTKYRKEQVKRFNEISSLSGKEKIEEIAKFNKRAKEHGEYVGVQTPDYEESLITANKTKEAHHRKLESDVRTSQNHTEKLAENDRKAEERKKKAAIHDFKVGLLLALKNLDEDQGGRDYLFYRTQLELIEGKQVKPYAVAKRDQNRREDVTSVIAHYSRLSKLEEEGKKVFNYKDPASLTTELSEAGVPDRHIGRVSKWMESGHKAAANGHQHKIKALIRSSNELFTTMMNFDRASTFGPKLSDNKTMGRLMIAAAKRDINNMGTGPKTGAKFPRFKSKFEQIQTSFSNQLNILSDDINSGQVKFGKDVDDPNHIDKRIQGIHYNYAYLPIKNVVITSLKESLLLNPLNRNRRNKDLRKDIKTFFTNSFDGLPPEERSEFIKGISDGLIKEYVADKKSTIKTANTEEVRLKQMTILGLQLMGNLPEEISESTSIFQITNQKFRTGELLGTENRKSAKKKD